MPTHEVVLVVVLEAPTFEEAVARVESAQDNWTTEVEGFERLDVCGRPQILMDDEEAE